MDATQTIKNRILDLARQNAARILENAETECTAQKNEALKDIAAQEAVTLLRADNRAEEIKSRRETLNKLENKKIELKAKQDMMDRVYSKVLSNLLALSDIDYAAFIERNIVSAAAAGDEVIVAEADKKRLGAEWLARICQKHNLRLSLSQETHSDGGGVILRNPKFDKTLTLSALIKQAREKTESEVITILFN